MIIVGGCERNYLGGDMVKKVSTCKLPYHIEQRFLIW